MEHLQLVLHALRGGLLFRTLGPVTLSTSKCSGVENSLMFLVKWKYWRIFEIHSLET